MPSRLESPSASRRWLQQGWSQQARDEFHFTSQGCSTFPVSYEWFTALEQPSASPAEASKLFTEPAFLAGFGFIVEERETTHNPDGLPVGFTRTEDFDSPLDGGLENNPVTGKRYSALGFNCAACHTGQLEYRGSRLLIDGGSATVSLGNFRKALQGAIAQLAVPERAGRFIQRVSAAAPTPEHAAALGAQLEGFLRGLQAASRAEQSAVAASGGDFEEGYFRLDALARIGNEIFWRQQRLASGAEDNELDENYAATKAPVNFPHLWDAPWFDWVQYNGSIMQPMFRNFTEALGVGAVLNLGPGDQHLASTVDVKSLFALERLLMGSPPHEKRGFDGLGAPKWPEDVLGPIDAKLAREGAALYERHCQGCHLPPPDSEAFWDEKWWHQDDGKYSRVGRKGHRYLALPLIPLDKIGTDPAQATRFLEREIRLPASLGGKVVSYATALGKLSAAIEKAYEAARVPEAERADFDGNRPNELRAALAYRPRPLDGIWATPPYLHNASVPTLYHLLSPVTERPTAPHLGSREFDPKYVGFEHGESPGAFELDTSLPGNLNGGHEFNDGKGKGIIGPKLKEAERLALVEYLKTL